MAIILQKPRFLLKEQYAIKTEPTSINTKRKQFVYNCLFVVICLILNVLHLLMVVTQNKVKSLKQKFYIIQKM